MRVPRKYGVQLKAWVDMLPQSLRFPVSESNSPQEVMSTFAGGRKPSPIHFRKCSSGMKFNEGPFGGRHLGGDLCRPATYTGFPMESHSQLRFVWRKSMAIDVRNLQQNKNIPNNCLGDHLFRTGLGSAITNHAKAKQSFVVLKQERF